MLGHTLNNAYAICSLSYSKNGPITSSYKSDIMLDSKPIIFILMLAGDIPTSICMMNLSKLQFTFVKHFTNLVSVNVE